MAKSTAARWQTLTDQGVFAKQDLDEKLADLHCRIHQGTYRAQPSKRAYIPKADGQQRPIGVPTLEDKIVQRAVTEVLSAIYEQDFLECSHGFRPRRSPHDALDAVGRLICRQTSRPSSARLLRAASTTA